MQNSRFLHNVRASRQCLMSTALLVVAQATLSPAWAQVSIGGDSTPSDPALVDGSVNLDIGFTSFGSLTVFNGSILTNNAGYVGGDAGGFGVVTVSGQDSR